MEPDSPPPPTSPLPIGHRLKRLKRASSAPPDEPPPTDPIPISPDPPQIGDSGGEGGDGLDPLFADRGRFTGCGAGDSGYDAEEDAVGGGGEHSAKRKKSAKKRLCLDGEEVKAEKKRRRKGTAEGSGDENGKKESVREKKRLEKERKKHIENLHAETQRLLRETKNASFNPAPLVQKPISSILEKIRLRKLEAMTRASELYCMDSFVEVNRCENAGLRRTSRSNLGCSVDNHSEDTSRSNPGSSAENHSDDVGRENDITASDNHHSSVGVLDMQDEGTHREPVLQTDCKDANHAPEIDILQDSIYKPPIKHDENEQPRKQPSNSPEKICPENDVHHLSSETSSDEEDYDKENTDPLKDKRIHRDSFERGDLARPFIDDEAEEEDDSDHDLMRFPEEDDDGDEESEEINDLIATAYEENPADQERRNQLHQEWLEQKDAAETCDMLQRLKHHQRNKDHINLDIESPDENLEEEPEDILNQDVSASAARREISKRAKQMMAQMFDTKDDAFVSSDEEEAESRLSRQRILEQTRERASILSPEDSNSGEVSNLIKKMNIAPDPNKRRMPLTATYEPLHLCGNSNRSLKSSFLGRVTSNSFQSSHKQCSATFKSYVFGRDDSNSKSAVTKPEDSSDTDKKEARQSRTASAKFSGSQPKYSKSNGEADTNSGPSLFSLLRRSSELYDQQLKASNQKDSAASEAQVANRLTALMSRSNISKK